MKTLLAVIVLMLITVTAGATDLNRIPAYILSYPGQPQAIQGVFGPNGSLVKKLTVNNTTQNLTNYVMFGITIPASLTTCQIRLSATAPSGNYGTNQYEQFPAAVLVTRSVNPATAFANISGCTNAYLTIQ